MTEKMRQREALIPKGRVRTRFAPSPTGYMHVGGLRTALYAYLIAKHAGGDFLLRIEDTDQERFVQGAIAVIYRTLRETGLVYDEGPDVGGPVGPYVQTERRGLYTEYADYLVGKGHAYPCFCDKERLDELRRIHEASHIAHKYDGCCARLSPEEVAAKKAAGLPFVIRQKMPATGKTAFDDVVFGRIEVDNSELDDNILVKSDGLPTYNFANVIDDHLMGITHIVRGTEYLASTPKYNLLYQAFGWDIPTYIHVSPVMKNATQKLSKRHGDPTYEDLLAMGYLRDAIVNYVTLLGWSPRSEQEIFSLSDLIACFDLEGLSKSPAIFNMDKLTWFNGQYLRRLSPAEFAALSRPYIEQTVKTSPVDKDGLAALLQERCEKLTDIPEQVDFFDAVPPYDTALYEHKKMKTDKASSLMALRSALPVLAALTVWSKESLHDALMALVAALGTKNGQLLYPLRVAVSGKAFTPGGGVELCTLLGKEETLVRVKSAVVLLEQETETR